MSEKISLYRKLIMAAKKSYWTIAQNHKGSALSSGVVYWRQDSIWTTDVDDAHHFRTVKTAEKNLEEIHQHAPNAIVKKINPNVN